MADADELFLQALVGSVTSMAQASEDVATIDGAAIEKLASAADAQDVEKAEMPGVGLPLRFDSLEAEVNFYALLQTLDFGSGWADSVKRETGREFREVILFGLMGMHLDGNKLDAESLAELTNFELGLALQLPISQEVEVMPAIRQDRDSDHKALVDLFHSTCQQVARKLQERGFKSLGHFILADDEHGFGSNNCQGEETQYTTAGIVRRLSHSFSSFCDEFEIEGTTVSFHRKACLLAQTLSKLGAEHLGMRFSKSTSLTAGADFQTARLLLRQGILKLDNGLGAKLNSRAVLKSGTRAEVGLRACSAEAVRRFSESLSKNLKVEVSAPKALAYLVFLDDGLAEGSDEIELRCVDTCNY